MLDLPNERSGKLLSILLENEDPLTTKKLAEELDVSARTIRSDLKKLENWLEERGIELIRKRGVGVWLEIDHSNKIELNRELANKNKYIFALSPAGRQQHILQSLLLKNRGKTTMQALADEMYVSKTTIYKDLDKVEEWLNKQDLKLIRKRYYGLEIQGKEKNWRKAFANLLVQLNNIDELNEVAEAEEELEFETRIDKQTYSQLQTLFPDTSFREIEEILEETEEELDFVFTDETFVGLVIHIAISIARLAKGQDIEMEKEQLDSLREKEEFEIASYLAEKIEKTMELSIPEAEIGYISLHILGAKHQQHLESTNINDILENTKNEIIEIAEDIISMTEHILNVDLSNDRQLLLGLVLHLRPTINRLKYGMSLRNPLLNQIKKNYSKVYRAAWAATIIFENRLGINIPEAEIGYIALHLGAALERLNSEISAVIVCGSGIGTSQLIATKVENKLPDLVVEEIMSIRELKSAAELNADIIISSVPLDESLEEKISQPTVYISSLLTAEDIKSIKNKIGSLKTSMQSERLDLNSTFDQVNSLFDESLIFLNMPQMSKEELIENLSEKLIEKDIVTEGFSQSALNRERMTSTAIGRGIAIPHAEKEFVNQSKVLLATLEEAVEWGDQEVDTVFLLALKDKETAGVFFKHFQFIMQNEELLNKIKNAEKSAEIKKIFLN